MSTQVDEAIASTAIQQWAKEHYEASGITPEIKVVLVDRATNDEWVAELKVEGCATNIYVWFRLENGNAVITRGGDKLLMPMPLEKKYASLPNITPDFVSVRDAAKILGVSERSVYGYIKEKKLPGFKATSMIVVSKQDLLKFKRGTTGRPRTRVPEWRISEADNAQHMTQIFIQIIDGKEEALWDKLEEIREQSACTFPGTVARYVTRAPGNFVQILLIWRTTVMPDAATRADALAELQQDTIDVLGWQKCHVEMHEVMMHT